MSTLHDLGRKDARRRSRRRTLGKFAGALVQGALLALVNGWYLMLAVGVVHHEWSTWLHLDVFDLAKQPTKPARKYTRKERYRYCAIISLPVCEVDIGNNPLHFELGRCKICTENWRSIYGYGSEDDLDSIDDLPWYQSQLKGV